MALGQAEASGDRISITAVIATWGGRCPLSIGAVALEAAGGEGGEGGKNNHGAADDDIEDAAAGGGGSWHYMWREEQIKQFVYLIRSGEGKRQWVMNDYDLEDARNLTMAAAADGNEVDSKKDGKENDNRWTSSAWSNFIVRILFCTLLLLA
jgi:hypothetical protein